MTDKRSLIVVDVETTGLDPNFHHPIEVAAINMTTGEELYFVPAVPVGALDQADGRAMQINRYFERGISQLRLRGDDSDNRWEELWNWLDGNTLAGCNPAFDAAMLQRGYASGPGAADPPWHYRLADLSAYAAPALHLPPNELVGLRDVCEALGVTSSGEHTALGDARAAAECFRCLTELYTDERYALWVVHA